MSRLNEKSLSNRQRLIFGGLFTLGAVLVAGVVTLAVPQNDGGIQQVADQFKPVGFSQVANNYTPKHALCLGGGACPEVERTYAGKQPYTDSGLLTLAEKSGWYAKVNHTCESTTPAKTGQVLCSLDGTAGNFRVHADQIEGKQGLIQLKVSLKPAA